MVRDMWALREIGVPIFAQDGAKGGYSLPGDYRLAPLPLTPREMFLLLLALDAIEQPCRYAIRAGTDDVTRQAAYAAA